MKTNNITKSLVATALIIFAANVFAKPKPAFCGPTRGELTVVSYVPGYQQLTDKQRLII